MARVMTGWMGLWTILGGFGEAAAAPALRIDNQCDQAVVVWAHVQRANGSWRMGGPWYFTEGEGADILDKGGPLRLHGTTFRFYAEGQHSGDKWRGNQPVEHQGRTFPMVERRVSDNPVELLTLPCGDGSAAAAAESRADPKSPPPGPARSTPRPRPRAQPSSLTVVNRCNDARAVDVWIQARTKPGHSAVIRHLRLGDQAGTLSRMDVYGPEVLYFAQATRRGGRTHEWSGPQEVEAGGERRPMARHPVEGRRSTLVLGCPETFGVRALGVRVELRDQALAVVAVRSGGPGHDAGLRIGDRITRVNEQDVNTVAGLRRTLAEGSRKARMQLLRDNEVVDTVVRVQRR